MSWQSKEPGHQQPWYWPSWTEFRVNMEFSQSEGTPHCGQNLHHKPVTVCRPADTVLLSWSCAGWCRRYKLCHVEKNAGSRRPGRFGGLWGGSFVRLFVLDFLKKLIDFRLPLRQHELMGYQLLLQKTTENIYTQCIWINIHVTNI